MNVEDRKAFEEWYDSRPNGRIEPADVWQAALEHARKWRPISEGAEGSPGAALIMTPH